MTAARRGRGRLSARALLFAALALIFTGAVAHTPAAAAAYVGAALGEVKPEDKAVVAHPQPVQLLFTFKSKGAPNAKATKLLKDKVTATVTASGLFSTISEAPVENGAVLSVVIDNVVDPDELAKAEGKGFVTGATFFIAGSTVADHYLATLDYVPGPGAAIITRTARHSVIIQMGMINSAPKDAVKVGKVDDAVYTMARQIVANPLNEIGRDPAFQGAAPAPASAPAPAEAAPAQPAPATAAPATMADPAPKG
jgi:hypothetical protein